MVRWFKTTIIINDKGAIMAFKVTSGNVDNKTLVPDLVKGLTGTLIGDKEYISNNLLLHRWNKGLHFITQIKKNMKNKLIIIVAKLLLQKHAIIEPVNDKLKNTSQIEHTRHRAIWNFPCNLIFRVMLIFSTTQKTIYTRGGVKKYW